MKEKAAVNNAKKCCGLAGVLPFENTDS